MPNTAVPVLYILMRNDLPSMNPGKAMAQASHASNAFVHYMRVQKATASPSLVDTWQNDTPTPDPSLVDTWQNQTPQGFGTVLVLAVNEDQMYAAVKVANAVGFYAGVVNDPTYPYRVSNEIVDFVDPTFHTLDPISSQDYTTMFRAEDTCAWVFVPDKSDPLAVAILGKFPLHP